MKGKESQMETSALALGRRENKDEEQMDLREKWTLAGEWESLMLTQ